MDVWRKHNMIWCSLRHIKYVGKSDHVTIVKKVKKWNNFSTKIKKLKVENKG